MHSKWERNHFPRRSISFKSSFDKLRVNFYASLFPHFYNRNKNSRSSFKQIYFSLEVQNPFQDCLKFTCISVSSFPFTPLQLIGTKSLIFLTIQTKFFYFLNVPIPLISTFLYLIYPTQLSPKSNITRKFLLTGIISCRFSKQSILVSFKYSTLYANNFHHLPIL